MERYGVRDDQLRVYLHYMPSYYHLHVHFVHVKHDAGAGMAAGKAHLLSDVIGAHMHPSILAMFCMFCSCQALSAVNLFVPLLGNNIFIVQAVIVLCDFGADNVRIMADYYKRRTLTFVLGERDPLMGAFCKRKASENAESAL